MSYEVLVSRPVDVIHHIAQNLDLKDVESMIRQVKLPSRTVTASTGNMVENPEYLLSRWRQEVSQDRERQLMSILEAFDLDVYVAGRDTPRPPFLLAK